MDIYYFFAPNHFYPRPPRGGRLARFDEKTGLFEFLSTPSARRATSGGQQARGVSHISIHALREEGDPGSVGFAVAVSRFLSTPSARRATRKIRRAQRQFRDFYPRPPRGGRRRASIDPNIAAHFYPRPPRGGRLAKFDERNGNFEISIHALREEGDLMMQRYIMPTIPFLSTPSARRATLSEGCS